jgi:GcrA cell cycle regulator
MLAVMWNAVTVKCFRELWTSGQSAGQIAQRLGCSRSAVAGKLQRLGLHRRPKPPTAKPVIVSVPKHIYPPAVVVPHALPRHAEPHYYTETELRAMLAEAAANTAQL